MYGAAAGDIVGSIYEIENLRSKDFPLFSAGSHFTDDTVLTAAIEKAILRWDAGDGELETLAVEELLHFFNAHPDAAYGGRFITWARGPEQKPYGSFGNGSAMRISGAGFYAETLDDAQKIAERITRTGYGARQQSRAPSFSRRPERRRMRSGAISTETFTP